MLSYEIQAVKPDKESYLKALALFSLQAKDCLFIDDRPINIKTANELGFTGHIHQNVQQTKQWLENYLDF
jgi:putative hydrolase of the HAD superfamily